MDNFKQASIVKESGMKFQFEKKGGTTMFLPAHPHSPAILVTRLLSDAAGGCIHLPATTDCRH